MLGLRNLFEKVPDLQKDSGTLWKLVFKVISQRCGRHRVDRHPAGGIVSASARSVPGGPAAGFLGSEESCRVPGHSSLTPCPVDAGWDPRTGPRPSLRGNGDADRNHHSFLDLNQGGGNAGVGDKQREDEDV